jgi:hypothetical protein
VLAHLGDIGVGPDDLRPIVRIQVLDALAWVRCNLSKGINRERQHSRQDLHSHIGGARRLGILGTPVANVFADAFGVIEMGGAKLAEIVFDPIEPPSPVPFGGVGKLFIVDAGLIRRDDRPEASSIWCAVLGYGRSIGGVKSGAAKIGLDRRPSPPSVNVHLPLGPDDVQAFVLNHSHASF